MDAEKSYSDSCAVCHGIDGTGKTKVANGLSPEVPDLHAEHIQKLTDGEMFYIIKNGVRFAGMPGWDLRDQQIWNLVFLLRQFAKDNPAPQGSGKSR
jgi:mono/diheme cytochrome c family protein